jgi:hypothetical protein
MKRQDFDDLVRRIESRYAGRQAALERATAAWSTLGMVGIAAWLGLLSLLGTAAFVAGVVLDPAAGIWLLGLGVVLIVYALSQAGLFLLIDRDRLEGRALNPGEAPPLAALLGSLREALRSRAFDEVRITMDFNAGVREIPRLGLGLGLFGWSRTILELGLPLLSVLSPDELRAVLAHEYVHLSARHGRSIGRTHRLHRRWCNVFEQVHRSNRGDFDRMLRWAATRFVDWYWPRLRARVLVLSRMQEHHADRVAAGIAGAAPLVSALWRMECVGPWLSEQFWTELYRQADQTAEPPADIMERLRTALETPPAAEDAARWTGRGLRRATGNDETHPAFVDRARALGVPAGAIEQGGFPAPVRPTAAEVLLGAELAAIEGALAEQWRQGARAAWRERHRRAASEAQRPCPEPTASESSSENPHQLWETARDLAQRRGTAASEPLLRALLESDPGHLGASVLLGHHLLGRGDAGGEGEHLLLQVVAREDEAWTPPAYAALLEHYRATGQTDRLREVRLGLDRYEAETAQAQRERAIISGGDDLLPHGLSLEQIEPLRHLLSSQPECGTAYLVRKKLRFFPHRPLFVLCVRGPARRWGFTDSERDRKLVQRLIPLVELPGQVLVIVRQGSFRRLAGRVIRFPGAEVFGREV